MVNNSKSDKPTVLKRVVKSTVAQVVSQVITSLLGVVTIKIITTSLGVHDYGYYATIYAFVTTFSLLTDLGLNANTAREIAKAPHDADTIIGHNMGLRITLSLIFVPAITGLSYLIYPHHGSSIHIGILIMALYLAFDAIRSVALAYFTSQVRGDISAFIVTVQQLVFTLMVVIVPLAGWGLYGFISAFVLSNLAGAVCAFYAARKTVRLYPRINMRYWKRVLILSASLGLIQIINMLYLKADSIMLSLLKDSYAVGIYSVAYSLIFAFLSLPSFLMSALIPSLATANPDKLQQIVTKAFQHMALFASLLAAGAFLVRHDIIVLVASSSYADAAAPFAILAFATAFTYLNSVFGYASVSVNKHHKLVYISALSLLCNIGLNLICIPRYGVIGAAWATVASELAALIGVYSVFARETGVRIQVVSPLGKTILAGVITSMLGSVISRLVAGTTTILHLGLVSIATGIIYITCLGMLRGLPQEYTYIFRQVRKRII